MKANKALLEYLPRSSDKKSFMVVYGNKALLAELTDHFKNNRSSFEAMVRSRHPQEAGEALLEYFDNPSEENEKKVITLFGRDSK